MTYQIKTTCKYCNPAGRQFGFISTAIALGMTLFGCGDYGYVGGIDDVDGVPQRLNGFADMHTHPMAHVAFGGKILYGTPDPKSTMLKGQQYRGFDFFAPECNPDDEPAGSRDASLFNCNAIHGGWGVDNDCGDIIRTAIIDKIEKNYVHEYSNTGLFGQVNDHPHAGYPHFTHWPHWSSVTHQQMYWEWIKRAFNGGLRVMVALAVNNALLAKAANAEQYVDDKDSIEFQLQEIKKFVGRHKDFMAIAKSPSDLRRIVESQRMAVVLGVETDDFGNLTRRSNFAGEFITQAQVDAEIDRLYSLGVRYIIPIHFSNTVLGGYAINGDLFALSSKEYSDNFPTPDESCGKGIHFQLKRVEFGGIEANLLRTRDLGRIIDNQPDYPLPSKDCGHQNSLGLTELGRDALQTMMNLGMMIDIDHMSRLAADETLAIARERDYPINSGHNGPLSEDCIAGGSNDLQHCTENHRTRAQYAAIRQLGGMVGLGHGGKTTTFVKSYRAVLEQMGNRPVAIGTDANGLESLPKPDPSAPVNYDSSFPRYQFGDKSWDFNEDGFAHYGMFPDFIRSWQTSSQDDARMTEHAMDAFMSSAEGFARTWEKSVHRASGAPHVDDLDVTIHWSIDADDTLHPGDFNGDGAVDLLWRDLNGFGINYAKNVGTFSGSIDWRSDSKLCPHAELHIGDFNGDGRSDLLCRGPKHIQIDYANRQGQFWATDRSFDISWCVFSDARMHLGDFNGDGRTDLLCRDANRLRITYADTSGGFYGAPDWSFDTSWCGHDNANLYLRDIDGDSRTDLLCRDPGSLRIDYADTSGHFAGKSDWSQDIDWCTDNDAQIHLGDFNGDGRMDLLCREPGHLRIDYANSEDVFSDPDWYRDTNWCDAADATLHVADVNGNGRTDLLCRAMNVLQVDYANLVGHFER